MARPLSVVTIDPTNVASPAYLVAGENNRKCAVVETTLAGLTCMRCDALCCEHVKAVKSGEGR